MSVNQALRVSGHLDIDAVSGYRTLAGEINFLGPSKTFFGRTRVIGSSGNYTMMLDTSGCNQGLVVRTVDTQGNDTIGGSNYQFALQVQDRTTKAIFLEIDQKKQGANTVFTGSPNLVVARESTETSTSLLSSALASFYQRVWKLDEEVFIQVGFAPFYGYCGLGYHSPTANPTNLTTNEGFLSIWNNGANIKAITWTPDGNVAIPHTLTVDTIFATTYLNLPAVPPPDLLPLTLDKANNRVGINRTNPTHDLDVAGTGRFNGLMVDNDGILELGHGVDGKDPNAGHINYASGPNQLVITGGGVGYPDRVVRIKDELHVDISIRTTNATLTGTLTADTISATTYLGMPPPNLLPIFLDTVNARVGINKAVPTEVLDVGGTVRADAYRLQSGSGMIQDGIDTIVYGGGDYPNRVVKLLDNVQIGENLRLTGSHHVEFGYQVAGKGDSAGRIWYDVPNNELNIVGAGVNGSRIVKIWDNLRVDRDFYTQLINGTAIGTHGQNSIYIGVQAGETNQAQQTIAIGNTAGGNTQQEYAIAIGAGAGQQTQGSNTIAIGRDAGKDDQGSASVAVGQYAGFEQQGENSIAIGPRAGFSNQHARSIILNATASDLNSTNVDACYIKPIRSTSEGPNLLTYNGTTGEVISSPLVEDKTSGSLTADTAAAPNATNSRSRVVTGAAGLYNVSCSTDAGVSITILNNNTGETIASVTGKYCTAMFAVDNNTNNLVVWLKAPSGTDVTTNAVTRFIRIR